MYLLSLLSHLWGVIINTCVLEDLWVCSYFTLLNVYVGGSFVSVLVGVICFKRLLIAFFSRGSLVPPKTVPYQLAAVPEFFFEAIAEFVLFCARCVNIVVCA